jgi:hypothetical protein
MKVVKKYRYAVIRSQSFIRSFLHIQHARLYVVLKYADGLETQWKAHQKKSYAKSQEDLKGDDRKKIKKQATSSQLAQGNRKDKRESVLRDFTLPIDQKKHAIKQDLSNRLKTYREKTQEYNAELEKYTHSRKQRLVSGSDILPPPKPIFKV